MIFTKMGYVLATIIVIGSLLQFAIVALVFFTGEQLEGLSRSPGRMFDTAAYGLLIGIFLGVLCNLSTSLQSQTLKEDTES